MVFSYVRDVCWCYASKYAVLTSIIQSLLFTIAKILIVRTHEMLIIIQMRHLDIYWYADLSHATIPSSKTEILNLPLNPNDPNTTLEDNAFTQ